MPGVEKADTLGAGRGPQSSCPESRSRGPRRVGGRGKERAEHKQESKQANLGWELRMENGRGEGCSERGERPWAPTGERESGVCTALLVNKKERGGASYCSAGKLQPALLIGLTEL